MGRMRDVAKAMVHVMRRNKKTFALYVVLRLVVLACAVAALVFGNYEAFFLCLLTLVLFLVPPFIEVNFSITIPETLEVVIALFIFAAEILGEVFHFYTIFPFWDTLLHTFNGFLAAAIGLALVSILNRSDRIAFFLSPFFCAVVAFCFSMTIGVLWEFFEFGMDQVFGLDMQKDTVVSAVSSVLLDPEGLQRPFRIDGIGTVTVNGQDLGLGGYLDIGLIDTMEDLFVNFVGALAFSVIGYRYLKSKGEGTFARRFVPVLSVSDEGLGTRDGRGGPREADAFREPNASGGRGGSRGVDGLGAFVDARDSGVAGESADSDEPGTLTV